MPRNAPSRPAVGARSSTTSCPKNGRLVARTSADLRTRQRHPLPLAIDEERKELERGRIRPPVPGVAAEHPRLVPVERRQKLLPELRAHLECVNERCTGLLAARRRHPAGQHPSPRWLAWAVDERHVELVDVQRLADDPRPIAIIEVSREARRVLAVRIGGVAPADHVRPDRDGRSGEVSPEVVQALVPVIDRRVIR